MQDRKARHKAVPKNNTRLQARLAIYVQCSTSCQEHLLAPGALTGHVLDLVVYHSLELLELLLPE